MFESGGWSDGEERSARGIPVVVVVVVVVDVVVEVR